MHLSFVDTKEEILALKRKKDRQNTVYPLNH